MARTTLVVALMAALVVTTFTTAYGETLTEGSGDRALLSNTEVNEGRELLAVGGIRAAEAPTYVGRKMLAVGGIRAAEAPVAGAAEAPAYGRKMLAVGGIRAAEAPAPGAYKDAAVSTGVRKMLAVGGIRAAYAPAPGAYKDAAVSTGLLP